MTFFPFTAATCAWGVGGLFDFWFNFGSLIEPTKNQEELGKTKNNFE
jgi:hypothetical protein